MSSDYFPRVTLGAIKQLKPVEEVSPKDTMVGKIPNMRHYFGVGRSAILIITAALTAKMSYGGGDTSPEFILDFGAGYGRVARFLRVAFAGARVEVTDHNVEGLDWCVERLGCFEMPSPIPEGRYDLIWVGSVFTHLPPAVITELLDKLVTALRPFGVLVFTTGGRLGAANLSGYLQDKSNPKYTNYNMSDDAVATILRTLESNAFGYADYHNRKGYGSALIKPEWIFSKMMREDLIRLTFQEMAWDTHQDVYAYMKLSGDMVDAGRKKGAYF